MTAKNYPAETAGRKAVSNVPVCYENWRILDVKKMLFEKKKELETINYIYVIDKNKKLLGVFSIKEIFRRPPSAKVWSIAEKNVVTIRPYADQEKVAILALNHNLKSVPVVNKDGKFLGVVSSDSILNILHSEDVEDFLKMAGINSPMQKILKGSFLYLFKVRIPWLVLGLFGGLVGASLITYLEGPLKENFILASFIPLILYMSGAVGNQTEILLIRNMVLDNRITVWKYLIREIQASLLIASVLSILLFLISFIFFNASYQIGVVLSSSLFIGILVAVLVGVFMPCFLKRVGKDPAVGSGPFSTIVRDILSLVIYFSVSLFLLNLV